MVLPSQKTVSVMDRFNIRVYGVLINEHRQVLVSDEWIRGQYFTKFPGGGLEYGEGTRDCLKREFMEEMNLNVEVADHLYTTDFFVQSAFHPDHQILSIYYRVHPLEPITVRLNNAPFEFDQEQIDLYNDTNETESFRFIHWDHFSEESVSLPIDKIVAGIIKSRL
jgi:8-oxo-dGTP diphosphatase